MLEITGDLFDCKDADAICITTNAIIKGNGANVMGRGCALEAKRRWPGIDLLLGSDISRDGSRVRVLTGMGQDNANIHLAYGREGSFHRYGGLPYHIVAFPTKKHWKDPSPPQMVLNSALQLVELAEERAWKHVVLPRPGCGAGELSWEGQVKPTLMQIMDDRFSVITF